MRLWGDFSLKYRKSLHYIAVTNLFMQKNEYIHFLCIGYAFHGCSSLTSVTIPDGVTSIGFKAFNGCSSLTTVNYKGSEQQWAEISIWGGDSPLENATIVYNYVPEGE